MGTYTRYSSDDIVISTDKLVTSTWSNNNNNLQVSYTSSNQAIFTSATSSGNFYIEVYNTASNDTTSEVQYAVSYGHIGGSGSLDFTNDTGSFGYSATKCIYDQYRQLVFGDEAQKFQFDTHIPQDIYIVNVNRSRYKQNLKPGSLNLYISGSGLGNLHLTDDSVSSTGSALLTNVGRQFNIVSGANGVRSGSNTGQVEGSSSYGLFYPDAGFMIFNPDALGFPWGNGNNHLIPARSASTATRNHEKLVSAISGAAHFIVDSEEKITSQYYFTRAKNTQFNYTTNPTFIDSTGNLNFDSMTDNPKVFITTIGLYNDNNDLIAVAKLSQPISKDFTKESLIRVKLDY